jgi:ectoine hydroxylase-related dioxygenase (phytanoyl-CoA dioxygenase family)
LIKRAFDKSWLSAVEKGIQKNIKNPSPYSEFLGEKDAYFFNDYFNWREIDEFESYVRSSPAGEIACKLMQSKKALFYHEHVLVKQAASSVKTPFHHDQPYYPVNGHVCSLWMPLEPVSMPSTLLFIRGSHRWGKEFIPRKFATQKNYEKLNAPWVRVDETCKQQQLSYYHNSPTDIFDNVKAYDIVGWEVEPGDVVCFNGLTMHGAYGNANGTLSRTVLSTRWMSGESTFTRRPWELSPPYTGGLQNGDSMECELFPCLYHL